MLKAQEKDNPLVNSCFFTVTLTNNESGRRE